MILHELWKYRHVFVWKQSTCMVGTEGPWCDPDHGMAAGRMESRVNFQAAGGCASLLSACEAHDFTAGGNMTSSRWVQL